MQRVRASTEFAGSHAPAPTRTPRAAPGCLQCQSRSAPRGVLCDSQPARKNLPRASPARGPLVWGGAWLKPMRCDLQALVLAQRGAGRAPLTCDARHAIRAWASLQARPEKSCLRVPGQNSMTQRRPDAPTPRSSGPPAKHFIVPPPPPPPPNCKWQTTRGNTRYITAHAHSVMPPPRSSSPSFSFPSCRGSLRRCRQPQPRRLLRLRPRCSAASSCCPPRPRACLCAACPSWTARGLRAGHAASLCKLSGGLICRAVSLQGTQPASPRSPVHSSLPPSPPGSPSCCAPHPLQPAQQRVRQLAGSRLLPLPPPLPCTSSPSASAGRKVPSQEQACGLLHMAGG